MNLISIPHTDLLIHKINLTLYKKIYYPEECCYILTDVTHQYLKNNDYNIRIEDINILKSKEWWLNLSLLNIKLPIDKIEYYNHIEFLPYQGFGVAKMNTPHVFPKFKKPIEYIIEGEIYRLIPLYYNYCITKDGKYIRNVINNFNIITYRREYYVYPTTSIYNSYLKKQVTAFIHKLVAYSWLENNDYYNKNIVDHIDKNKKNYNVINLQWISASENLTRKYYDKHANNIIIRNIDTKEILYFPNLKQVSKFLKRSSIDIKRTPLQQGKIWNSKKGRYEIYYNNTFSHWEYETTAPITQTKKRTNYNNLGIDIFDIKTDKIETFIGSETIKKISKKYKITKDSVWRGITNTKKLINNRYLIRIHSDKKFNTEYEKPFNLAKQILAVNVLTGEKITFKSMYKLHTLCKKDYKTITKIIRDNKEIIINNVRYKLSMLSEN